MPQVLLFLQREDETHVLKDRIANAKKPVRIFQCLDACGALVTPLTPCNPQPSKTNVLLVLHPRALFSRVMHSNLMHLFDCVRHVLADRCAED